MAVGLVIYSKVRAFKAKAKSSRPRPRPENPKAKKFGLKARDVKVSRPVSLSRRLETNF